MPFRSYPNYSYIRHIVIHEAQDYTKFQMALISKIFKNSSLTILGDVNQTINPHFKYNSLKDLDELFDGARYIELNRAYRSSLDIIEYSNDVLDLNNVSAMREGNNISVTRDEISDDEISQGVISEIFEMKDLGFNNIAIITRDKNIAKKIYSIIKTEVSELQLIVDPGDSLNGEVVIIPSYLSKGLEFEGVILYNSFDDSFKDDESNLYYVCCTRAQHKLVVFNEPANVIKKTRKI